MLFVLNAVTQVYMFSFYAYVEGCIEPPRNGTWVCENLFSAAYNYAAGDGDKTLLAGLQVYNERRSRECATYLQPSAQHQTTAAQHYDTDSKIYALDAAGIALAKKCLDFDKTAAGDPEIVLSVASQAVSEAEAAAKAAAAADAADAAMAAAEALSRTPDDAACAAAMSGVVSTDYLSAKVLVVKSAGLVCSFAAGLSIGREGAQLARYIAGARAVC